MNIGKLDKRIQIIKLISGGVDAEGYDTDAVEELVWECWAQVSQTSGTELIKADAELSDDPAASSSSCCSLSAFVSPDRNADGMSSLFSSVSVARAPRS